MSADHYKQPKRASEAAIRNQVERILASDSFAGSNKLNQLLAFLVAQALEGHSPNEYSIAMDVFQKDESFDPRIDPLVRVYLCRLRNKLNHYRTTAGLNDPVEIELPPRTYAPRIRVRPRPMPFRMPDAANAARNVIVGSFRYLGSEGSDEYFCEGLAEELIHAMTKIKHLRVIPIDAVKGGGNASINVRDLYEKLRVEAILDGNVRKGAHTLRVSAHLTNTADGSVIWSEMYQRHIDDGFAIQLFAIQEEIANAIVAALWAGRGLALLEQPLQIPADNLKDVADPRQHVSSEERGLKLAYTRANQQLVKRPL